MIKVKEIAFVSYAVKDIKKAQAFYEQVLGLTPGQVWVSEDGNMGFVEYYMGEHTLAIGAGADNFTSGKAGATAALEVENFDDALEHLKKNEVKFLMESKEFPSCRMVLIEDLDGNQIMIHQRKK